MSNGFFFGMGGVPSVYDEYPDEQPILVDGYELDLDTLTAGGELVTIEEFTEAANDAGLDKDIMEKEPEAVSGKMRLIRLQITYRVTCSIDGSYIEVVTLGDGMDTGDKASGKAMSYAYKSLMFQLFCIPVVGQPDTDKDASPEEPPPFLTEDIIASARCAADSGLEAYRAFFAGITPDQRKAMVSSGLHEELKSTAANADAEAASISH